MKVSVLDPSEILRKAYAEKLKEPWESREVTFSDDRAWAVARRGDDFYALRVVSAEEDLVRGELTDCFFGEDDALRFITFYVDWDCEPYGFCKVYVYDPEGDNPFRTKRLWFDRELYKRKKEELHGAGAGPDAEAGAE